MILDQGNPLLNPMTLNTIEFRSDSWKTAMTHLYRVILVHHRLHLAPLQREFGDKFVQTEFRRHRSSNEKFSKLFYLSWCDYVRQLQMGVTSKNLTRQERSLLNEEQTRTLGQIRSTATQVKMFGSAASLTPE